MRIFYEEWNKVLNHQLAADDLVLTSFQSALVISVQNGLFFSAELFVSTHKTVCFAMVNTLFR